MVLGEAIMDVVCYRMMQSFVRRYVKGHRLSVCDIGSMDINGSFRKLFVGHYYTGLDIAEGPNVDVVTKDLYRYPFGDETFDCVVSGSVLEHVKDIYGWVREIKRITKKGGIICIIAPSHFRLYHPHPVDCWRIFPDGMRFLLGEVAGLQVMKARKSTGNRTVMCVGVGRRKD